MAQVSIVADRIRRHIELKRAGVTSVPLRRRMIAMEDLRRTDFLAWVMLRRRMDVFQVIELDGQAIQRNLMRGKNAFLASELFLVQASALNARGHEGARIELSGRAALVTWEGALNAMGVQRR